MKALGFSFIAFLLVGCGSTVTGTGHGELNSDSDAQVPPTNSEDSGENPSNPNEKKNPSLINDAGSSDSSSNVDPVCTDFTYSPFGECKSDGTHERTLVSSSPDRCVGGTPILNEQCACEALKIQGPGILTGPTVDLQPAPQNASCVETWAKMSPTTDWPAIVFSMGENIANQENWEIGCSSTGYLEFVRYVNGTARGIGSNSNCNDGNFHHVAVCFYDAVATSNIGTQIFLDGSLKGSQDTPGNLKSGILNFGGWLQYPTQATTVLDDIRVSKDRRYTGPFVPQKHLTTDASTASLFHLDESPSHQISDTKGSTLTLPAEATWSNECP